MHTVLTCTRLEKVVGRRVSVTVRARRFSPAGISLHLGLSQLC